MSDEGAKSPKKARKSPKSAGDYEVGFGRPPASGMYKKGQGGWPKGKKRGPRKRDPSLDAAFGRKIQMTENGVRKKVTVTAAIISQLQQAAVNGDLKAIPIYLKLAVAHGALDADRAGPIEDAEAQAVRQQVIARLTGFVGFLEFLMDIGGIEFKADGTPVARGWLLEAAAGQPSIKEQMRVRVAPKPQGGGSDSSGGG